MGDVAEMIAHQASPGKARSSPRVVLGARMLRVAADLDRHIGQGMATEEAVARVERTRVKDRDLIDTLQDFEDVAESVVKAVTVKELNVRMALDEDVRAGNGMLIAKKGYPVSGVLIERLRGFDKGVGVKQPFRVRIAA